MKSPDDPNGDYEFDLPKKAEDPPPMPQSDSGGIAVFVLICFVLLTCWSIGELVKAVAPLFK